MKKLALICVSSFMVLASCTKEKRLCCVLPPSEPFIMADKGSDKWHAEPEILKIGNDSIAITGKESEARLSLHIKFTGKGTYALKDKQATYSLTVGQDVSVAEYALDNTAVNKVEVIDYDPKKGVIWGTFAVTLKKIYANPTEAYPDQIKFLNGQFSEALPK